MTTDTDTDTDTDGDGDSIDDTDDRIAVRPGDTLRFTGGECPNTRIKYAEVETVWVTASGATMVKYCYGQRGGGGYGTMKYDNLRKWIGRGGITALDRRGDFAGLYPDRESLGGDGRDTAAEAAGTLIEWTDTTGTRWRVRSVFSASRQQHEVYIESRARPAGTWFRRETSALDSKEVLET